MVKKDINSLDSSRINGLEDSAVIGRADADLGARLIGHTHFSLNLAPSSAAPRQREASTGDLLLRMYQHSTARRVRCQVTVLEETSNNNVLPDLVADAVD